MTQMNTDIQCVCIHAPHIQTHIISSSRRSSKWDKWRAQTQTNFFATSLWPANLPSIVWMTAETEISISFPLSSSGIQMHPNNLRPLLHSLLFPINPHPHTCTHQPSPSPNCHSTLLLSRDTKGPADAPIDSNKLYVVSYAARLPTGKAVNLCFGRALRKKKKGSSKFDSPSAASSLESYVQARVNDERVWQEKGIYTVREG